MNRNQTSDNNILLNKAINADDLQFQLDAVRRARKYIRPLN